MSLELPKSARRVQRAIAAAGIRAQVVELPASTRTAANAAAAIGCRVEQIAKSLVFRCTPSDEPVLVIASGTNRVDERLVSSHLNVQITKADANFVRVTTGFAIGGVPPVGHIRPLRTLIDEDLLKLDTIWAAAGTPYTVVSLEPRQLVEATSGQVVAVAGTKVGGIAD